MNLYSVPEFAGILAGCKRDFRGFGGKVGDEEFVGDFGEEALDAEVLVVLLVEFLGEGIGVGRDSSGPGDIAFFDQGFTEQESGGEAD